MKTIGRGSEGDISGASPRRTVGVTVNTGPGSAVPMKAHYRRFSQRVRMLREVAWKYRRFGLWFVAATVGPIYPRFTRFFFRLDEVLYPDLADVDVDRPIFVMGHPRSGTSYFQSLVAQSDQFSMYSTWQIIFPSVVQRKIAGPLVRLFRRFDIDILLPATRGHEVRLEGIEEEEGLFAHLLESDLVTYVVPWILVDNDQARQGLQLGYTDAQADTYAMQFFRECLKRHVYCTGRKRVVAKVNPMVFRMRAMARLFPDVRIVYLVRSPVQAVASFFSLVENFVGPLLSPEQAELFFRRRYLWSVELYRHFEEMKDVVPPNRRIAIPFHELTGDTRTAMERFFALAETETTEDFWKRLKEGAHRPHRRRHRTRPLSHFGFNPRRVARDLQFVMQRYGVGE